MKNEDHCFIKVNPRWLGPACHMICHKMEERFKELVDKSNKEAMEQYEENCKPSWLNWLFGPPPKPRMFDYKEFLDEDETYVTFVKLAYACVMQLKQPEAGYITITANTAWEMCGYGVIPEDEIKYLIAGGAA